MNLDDVLRKLAPNAQAMVAGWKPGEGALLITEVEDGLDAAMVIPMPRAELLEIMVEGLALHDNDTPENQSTLEMLRNPPRGAVPWVASCANGRTAVGLIVPKTSMSKGGSA